MNIQQEKEEIIRWPEEVKDDRIVRQLSIIRNSTQNTALSKSEKPVHTKKQLVLTEKIYWAMFNLFWN